VGAKRSEAKNLPLRTCSQGWYSARRHAGRGSFVDASPQFQLFRGGLADSYWTGSLQQGLQQVGLLSSCLKLKESGVGLHLKPGGLDDFGIE
jgi:hypothetical protein